LKKNLPWVIVQDLFQLLGDLIKSLVSGNLLPLWIYKKILLRICSSERYVQTVWVIENLEPRCPFGAYPAL